eukprot:6213536-Pleurochrysis_carterae.AAC.1
MSEEIERPSTAGPTVVEPFDAADSVDDFSSTQSEKIVQKDAAAPAQADVQAMHRKFSPAPAMDDSGITVTELDEDEIDLAKFDRSPETIPDA